MKTVCIKTINQDKINFLIEELEKYPVNFYISVYRFKTFDNLIIHYPEKEDIDTFYKIVAISIKKCIEKFYEVEFLEKCVEKNYFYLSNIEREYIKEISKKVVELPDEKIGGKNKILEKLIENYIKENKKIVLEGFINFRLKEYIKTYAKKQ